MIDYSNSILALIASLLNHYGHSTKHQTLPELDKLLIKDYNNIIVMLFDGMGTAIIEKHLSNDTFLRKHLKSSLSSVFPPTTTAATTTIETGLSPIEHGWLGWSLYFDEIDANVNLFPNTISGSGGIQAADYHVARKYIPYKDVFTKIRETGNAEAYYVSPFSSYNCKTLDAVFNTVQTLSKSDKRKYIYSYWHQPDFNMHELGTESEIVKKDILDINDRVERLSKSLKDTLLIVTADHGLIDTTWKSLTDYPSITDCLRRAPCLESRALAFFIKPGMEALFEREFTKYFSDCYKLYTKQEVIESKIFGNGTPNKRSFGFIGEYLAIAFSNISIESSASTEHAQFKAAHAGLTENELSIPFIAIDLC